jgi:hypothetical protein
VLGINAVDVVILNDAPPELGRRIVTQGQRLYCADRQRDHAFVRDVQLRAADLASFLRRHLDYLRDVRPQMTRPELLGQELVLHNDVLFSLLMIGFFAQPLELVH